MPTPTDDLAAYRAVCPHCAAGSSPVLRTVGKIEWAHTIHKGSTVVHTLCLADNLRKTHLAEQWLKPTRTISLTERAMPACGIEVTPEMIEAGKSTIFGVDFDADDLVVRVYLAMVQCREGELPDD